MNKKYDYLELLSKLDNDQYRVYLICSVNSRYFGTLIFNNLSQDTEVNKETFNRMYFCEWLNQLIDNNVTRLESEVIKWIYNYPGFLDFYKGDWSVDSVLNSVIQSWKNKPHTLRLNKLSMLYANYMRFLGTSHGQDFLYGSTAYNILDYSDKLSDENSSPYIDEETRIQNLILCKKQVILDVAKNGVEVCEASAIWNSIFNTEGNYNLTKALKILKADPKMSKMSDMQMRRHLKIMKVKILKSLLKDDKLEKYFDTDYSIEINGKCYSLRSAIEMFLLKTESSLELYPNKNKHTDKIINNHVNIKAFTRDEFKETIARFCQCRGIYFSFATGYYNGVAKLKIDSDFKPHKSYKLWIYNGGGYKDFYNDTTGYITDIIPQEFFNIDD